MLQEEGLRLLIFSDLLKAPRFLKLDYTSVRNYSGTDKQGTLKNFCDKDFAELSGQLSGATSLETLV